MLLLPLPALTRLPRLFTKTNVFPYFECWSSHAASPELCTSEAKAQNDYGDSNSRCAAFHWRLGATHAVQSKTSVQQNCIQAGSPHINPENLTSQQNHQNDESGIRTHALSDQICASTGSETRYTALVWRLRPLGHLTMPAVLRLQSSPLCDE